MHEGVGLPHLFTPPLIDGRGGHFGIIYVI
ncbi:hypothetical protein CsSME_00013250 [Camellia sinensis var. sinensis]